MHTVCTGQYEWVCFAEGDFADPVNDNGTNGRHQLSVWAMELLPPLARHPLWPCGVVWAPSGYLLVAFSTLNRA